MPSHNRSYANELPSQNSVDVQRILAAFSCIALILVTITFSFGVTRPSNLTISDISSKFFTSLSPNSIMSFDVYVGLMFISQITYLANLLATQNESLLISATRGVSYNYILFNCLQILQVALWCFQKFALVELLLIANIINLAVLGLRLGPSPHKTTTTKNIAIQIPLVKMPLALDLMWLLQNTAILYKHLQFAATIDHLVICIFVALAISIAVILRDSLLSLGLTYLLFSLGTEQFAHRNDDQLQYILVFTLASVMLLATVVVGVPRFRNTFGMGDSAERRSLLP